MNETTALIGKEADNRIAVLAVGGGIRAMRWSRSPLLLLPLAFYLSSCTDDRGGADGTPAKEAAGSGMTEIYADLLREELWDGENGPRREYQEALKNCREAGLSITPLSEDEVVRVGTRRIQLWYGPGFEAERDEGWSFTVEGLSAKSCIFSLQVTGEHSFSNRKGWAAVDLATGERSEGEMESADAFDRYPVSPDDVAEENFGFTKTGTRRVAGQECIEWTSTSETGVVQCMWSQGMKFGFSPTPSDNCLTAIGDHDLVLSEEPRSGTGCRITAQRLTVGAPLDIDEYKPRAQ